MAGIIKGKDIIDGSITSDKIKKGEIVIDDSDLVHKSGDETIEGRKTFTDITETAAIRPAIDSLYGIGSSSLRYDFIIVRNVGAMNAPVKLGQFDEILIGGVNAATVNDIPDTSGFVTLSTNQEITGVKTFSSQIISVGIRPDGVGKALGSTINRWNDIHVLNVGAPVYPVNNGYFTNLQKGGVEVATVDDISALREEIDALKARLAELE